MNCINVINNLFGLEEHFSGDRYPICHIFLECLKGF